VPSCACKCKEVIKKLIRVNKILFMIIFSLKKSIVVFKTNNAL
jgi:hypothetical protein